MQSPSFSQETQLGNLIIRGISREESVGIPSINHGDTIVIYQVLLSCGTVPENGALSETWTH